MYYTQIYFDCCKMLTVSKAKSIPNGTLKSDLQLQFALSEELEISPMLVLFAMFSLPIHYFRFKNNEVLTTAKNMVQILNPTLQSIELWRKVAWKISPIHTPILDAGAKLTFPYTKEDALCTCSVVLASFISFPIS